MRFRLNYLTAFAGAFVGALLTFLVILGVGQLYLLTHAGRLDRRHCPAKECGRPTSLAFLLTCYLCCLQWQWASRRAAPCPSSYGLEIGTCQHVGWAKHAPHPDAGRSPPPQDTSIATNPPWPDLRCRNTRNSLTTPVQPR